MRAIIQSTNGYLWLGTLEGLARFDGLTFTTIEPRTFNEMRGQSHVGLVQSRDGSIWFSNGHGLSRRKGNKVTTYGLTNGLPSENVNVVFSDSRGELIVGTDKGLCKLSDTNFVPFAASDPTVNSAVRAILEDHVGNLWFGTAKGLFKFSDGVFVSFAKEQGSLAENSILSLAEGTNGCIWVGTSSGLTRIDAQSRFYFTRKEGLVGDAVRALCRDRAGSLWVGTDAGLQRLPGEKLPFVAYTNSTTIQADNSREIVYTIFEDDEQNIWVGMNRGLARLKRERFKIYSTKEGLPHRTVNSVYEDSRGRIWLGTGNGVARIEQGKVFVPWGITNATSTNRFPRVAVLSFLEDDAGDIWFGTRVGLYRFKEAENSLLHYTAEKSKLADNTARCLLQFNSKTYFIGNNTGLTRYRFQLFTNFGEVISLPFSGVKALVMGKEGRFWAGSEEGLTVVKGYSFKRFTMKDGLSSEWVNALYTDKDETLWIGTENGGLDRLKNGRVVAITPAAAGIFSERIYSIVEDDEENLWMGSRHGIFRASRRELNDFADGKISSVHCVSYGQTDGLRSVQCSGVSQPASCKGRDGRLWFATQDGVAVIDSRNLPINTAPPKIVMQNLVVDGQLVQHVQPQDQMRLSPGKGNLQFEYTAICLQAPEKVRFKYMLEGIDSDWLDAGTRRVASYGNLPPGDYRFLLRACNNDEVWTTTPTSFAFALAPHFYQRKIFYAACIGLVAFAIFVFHNLGVRAMARRQKELAELVAHRTEHLENALKSMEAFTYSMAHDLRAPLRAVNSLTHVLIEEYRQHFDAIAVGYAKRIEGAVTKMDDLIRDLLTYGRLAHSKVRVGTVDLEAGIERVLAECQPQIAARNAVLEVDRPLPEVVGNGVLLEQMLINIVSNGLKFVAPGTTPRVRIWAEHQQNRIRICVRDNGIGIEQAYHERIFRLFERLHADTAYPGTGVGLAIVRKGVERMGGTVGVQSEAGKGSCFWLELPATRRISGGQKSLKKFRVE